MSTLPSTSMPDPPRRRRGPVLLLIAVVLVVALLAALVIGWAAAGRGDPGPTPTTDPTPTESTSTGVANGCLGGAADLDDAVLAAQQEAPLTEVGAAEFAATYLRWAGVLPPTADHQATAQQLWSADATTEVTSIFDDSAEFEGWLSRPNMLEGRYYVEEFSAERAVVSVLFSLTGTRDGQPLDAAEAVGALTLVATDGQWRVQDFGGSRSINDLKSLGTPYAGGC